MLSENHFESHKINAKIYMISESRIKTAKFLLRIFAKFQKLENLSIFENLLAP